MKPAGLWNPDQLSVRVEMLPLMRVGRFHKQPSYIVAPPVGIPNTLVVPWPSSSADFTLQQNTNVATALADE